MFIIAVGLNHRTAPVEIREQLAYTRHDLPVVMKELRNYSSVNGCVILSTCNRTELYITCNTEADGIAAGKTFLSNSCRLNLEELEKFLYTFNTPHTVCHLFRVSAGLDSMILGEDQILAQVAEAYEIARESGTTNNVLNTLWQQAISVGKRVRTETRIDSNAVSISYAAVELARQVFDRKLEGKTILVIGAGKMSTLAARYLKDNGVTSVLVSNRSYDRAVALANSIGGRAIRFDLLEEYLKRADIVISCTAASHYILRREQIAKICSERDGRPLMLVDIAVPRDIEPEVRSLPGIKLYDIDDLQKVVLDNLEERKVAARQAEGIISVEIDEFFQWFGSLYAVPTIVALKKKAESIKKSELTKAFNRLGDLTSREQKIISSLANTILNKFVHDAVINLKEAALTPEGHVYTKALQKLFNLSVEEDLSRQEKAAKEREETDNV
ncbi:MAG: glutamyl-tRNA reductase [Clostridia bacterium]|nr:glutamyl-tRNA reductase [Clostridia bacterium]